MILHNFHYIHEKWSQCFIKFPPPPSIDISPSICPSSPLYLFLETCTFGHILWQDRPNEILDEHKKNSCGQIFSLFLEDYRKTLHAVFINNTFISDTRQRNNNNLKYQKHSKWKILNILNGIFAEQRTLLQQN